MTGPLINTERLHRLRLAAGLTERGLARRLATTGLYVRRLEHGLGHRELTLGKLHLLATALGCQPIELLEQADGSVRPAPPRDSPPARPLNLTEARLLHEALNGTLRLTGRGPRAAQTAHLLHLGLLIESRTNPTSGGRIFPSPAFLTAITGEESK